MDREQLGEQIDIEQTPFDQQVIERDAKIRAEFARTEGDDAYTIQVTAINTRQSSKGIKEAYLFSVDYSQYDTIKDRLRDTPGYGTGLYRIRVYKNTKVFAAYDLEIIAPEKIVEAPKPPESSSELAKLFRDTIEASDKRNAALLERILASQAAPLAAAVDPFAMFEKALAVTAKMIAPPPPQSNPMDMFMKGVELAATLKGDGGEGESGMMDILRDLAKSETVQNALANALNRPPAIAAQPAAEPARLPGQQRPAQVAPAQHPAQPPGNTMTDFATTLRYLLGKAKSGSDPNLYADWLYDNLPIEAQDTIAEMPDIIERCIALVPEIADHRPWFETCIETLRGIIHDATKQEAAPLDATDSPADNLTGNDR